MTRFLSALCLLLAGLPAAAGAQTIDSFFPASGPVGTPLTLRGSGLDAVTAVDVNGTECLILDRTATALRLLVMPGATTGPVSARGGAPATTAASFAVTRAVLTPVQQGPKLVGTGAVGPFARQGYALALSADGATLAVGGPSDGADGLGGAVAGAAWVFTRSGAGWSQQGPKLVGTGATGPSVSQGSAVALSADGSTLVVGGEGDDNRTGAAWVFTRRGSIWAQQGPKLVGARTEGSAVGQGAAVALSADGAILAVGGGAAGGSAWVFTRSGSSWSQQGPTLVGAGGPGPGASQWAALALSADGSTLAIGGPGDNGGTGAAWVFARRGTSWAQQGPKLVGAGAIIGTRTFITPRGVGGPSVLQGAALALSADGGTLAVGGPGDDTGQGATWVFTRSGTTWAQQGPKLVGTGAVVLPDGPPSRFSVNQGYAVALSADGATLAVGGPGDTNASGATWAFTRSGTTWAQQGPKLVGTGAVPFGAGPWNSGSGQGQAVALSADGSTLAVGAIKDIAGGATWVFSTASTPLAQRAAPPPARAGFYPNPVAGQLIVSGGAPAGTLRLLDAAGRAWLARPYRRGEPVDLRPLAPGPYWLQLDQGPAQPLLKR